MPNPPDPAYQGNRKLRVGEIIVALNALALARGQYSADNEFIASRLDEIAQSIEELGNPSSTASLCVEVIGGGNGTSEIGVDDFDAWSHSYDEATDPLMEFALTELKEHLAGLPTNGPDNRSTALDLGCATGQLTHYLTTLNFHSYGLDWSKSMIEVALRRTNNRNTSHDGAQLDFLCHDIRSIPNGSLAQNWPEQHDLVTCLFTLCHIDDLTNAARFLASQLQIGGRAIIVEPHPNLVGLGTHGFYTAGEQQIRALYYKPHQISDYMCAFDSAGLEIRYFGEPKLKTGDGPLASYAAMCAPIAAEAAYLNLPGCVVWVLGKKRKGADIVHYDCHDNCDADTLVQN